MAPSLAHSKSIAVAAGTVAFAILSAVIVKKWLSKSRIPKDWTQVGKVRELNIYPLKSGKGSKVDSVFVTEKGVQEIGKSPGLRDRSFIIYNSENNEIRTARQLPKTVLISIQAADNGIILSAPNKVDLYISLPKSNNDVKVTLVWGGNFGSESLWCSDCGNSAAKWVSDVLLNKPEGLRLGYGDGKNTRRVVQDHIKWASYYTKMDNKMAGIFSDLAALHLINSSSVEDLVNRIKDNDESQVTASNFRPNILIEGPGAFEEDHWEYVKIGNVVTKVCMECLRCIETLVGPNGEVNKHREPLKTLTSFRMSEGPFKYAPMGIYLMVLKTGKIQVGDPVFIPKNA